MLKQGYDNHHPQKSQHNEDEAFKGILPASIEQADQERTCERCHIRRRDAEINQGQEAFGMTAYRFVSRQ